MHRVFLAAPLLLVGVMTGRMAGEEKKPVKPKAETAGTVADDAAAGPARTVADAKAFEKLWADWKIPADAPKVDFAKEFVVVVTSRGSRLNVVASLSSDDLNVTGVSTRDLRPGTRYVMAVFERDGVKKVNGKELK